MQAPQRRCHQIILDFRQHPAKRSGPRQTLITVAIGAEVAHCTLDVLECKAILTRDRHMFFATAESESRIEGAIDQYGDSFARDVTVNELKEVRRCSDNFATLDADL